MKIEFPVKHKVEFLYALCAASMLDMPLNGYVQFSRGEGNGVINVELMLHHALCQDPITIELLQEIHNRRAFARCLSGYCEESCHVDSPDFAKIAWPKLATKAYERYRLLNQGRKLAITPEGKVEVRGDDTPMGSVDYETLVLLNIP